MGSLWNRSGVVERYADDLRASGAKAYFFAGGTTTALVVYRDAGEGSAFPIPVVADANGRWPDVFVPYSTVGFDVQVTSADDVQLTFTQRIPNPNPVDVSVTVPTDKQMNTGMIVADFVASGGVRSGYVRLNGKTIGTAASGATERGNGTNNIVGDPGFGDTWNLYTYLYTNVPSLQLFNSSGSPIGRTNATADFNGNNALALPDMRGANFS